MKERGKFLERRRKGIGGSDVGAILGVDPYRDSLDVWTSKVKPSEKDFEQTPQMERGTRMEPIVADLYAEQSGRKLRLGSFRRHGKYRHFIGNPDRMILAASKPPRMNVTDGIGVLELKTANRYVFDKMKKEGLPQSYILQLQHYMAICRCRWGAFGVLCPDPWEFVTFVMEFDKPLFNEVAVVLNKFWTEHVETGVPPIPVTSDIWHDAPKIPDDEPVVEMDSPEWALTVATLREATELRKAGEAAEKYAKDTIKMLCQGDSEEPRYGVFQGAGVRAYHRLQAGRTTFNRRALEAMEPLDPIRMASLLTRSGLSLDVIEELFTESRLELSRFDKQGDPFATLRVYDSKGDDR